MHRRALQSSTVSLMSCKSSVMTTSRQMINALPHTHCHGEGRKVVNHSLLMGFAATASVQTNTVRYVMKQHLANIIPHVKASLQKEIRGIDA